MSDSPDKIPSFEDLLADPEIAALLDFEPVPRKLEVEGGWSPAKQQEFIARLGVHGSKNRACNEMGMHTTGMTKVQNSPNSKSFRAAWERAVALARRRREEAAAESFVQPGTRLPTIDYRHKLPHPNPLPHAGEGEVLNEFGQPEDEAACQRRGAEAGESIAGKLLRIRRLYLQEISGDPGKRAAFEILTELPVDWDRAARLEPQPDEPYRTANQHEPDMILTAESGWSWGEIGYGPDRKAQARAAIDARRAELGQEPIEWGDEA